MRMGRFVALLTVMVSAAGVGCGHKEHVQANAPPQGYAPDKPSISDYYAYHNDQGMLADMSLADIHFIPNSPELSGTGVARLERYAELLAPNGGTLYYDTGVTDMQLVDRRLSNARTYLAQCAPSKQRIDVVLGMPQGPGMRSKEAIAGAGVAEQPEARDRAYHLQEKLSKFNSGSK